MRGKNREPSPCAGAKPICPRDPANRGDFRNPSPICPRHIISVGRIMESAARRHGATYPKRKRNSMKTAKNLLMAGWLLLCATAAHAALYQIGPTRGANRDQLTDIAGLLNPGDVVEVNGSASGAPP